MAWRCDDRTASVEIVLQQAVNILVTLACLLGGLAGPLAGLELGTPFSDHMVLQRERPVLVWGWSEAGRQVTVALAGDQVQVEADAKGRWRAELPARQAGGPHELRISAGGTTLRVRDVLVGEVWLCSGQSNMEWPVERSDHLEDNRAAAAALPRIRRLAVDNWPAARPSERGEAVWELASHGVDTWSAVAFEAARRLHEELEVPIGIIQADWGGTRIEAWMPAAAVDDDADFAAEVATDEEGPRQELAMAMESGAAVVSIRRLLAGANEHPQDPGRQARSRDWERPDFDDGKWAAFDQPQVWEQGANLHLDGAMWFRRTVEIPKDWQGKNLVIELGAIDDFDDTWFEGHHIGRIGSETADSWRTPRRYELPGKWVKPGRRTLAVRVWDHMGAGGFSGKPEEMRIHPVGQTDQARSLAGAWKWQIELAVPERASDPGDGRNQTTVLYNGMIAPLLPYPLAGVLWYQGESNAGAPGHYAKRFPILIKRWRQAFDQPALPLLFVQLPGYGQDSDDPNANSWARIREAQTAALALDGVHMAVTIDHGDEQDVHPRNKRPVGQRLAALALREVYDRELVAHGPVFREWQHAEQGGPLRIHFDHAAGLTTTDGEAPRAFFIAGEDKRWFPAEAKLDGDAVILSHPQVKQPVAVRYAWTAFPPVNLINAAGLPAAPFRSDDW